MKGLLVYERTNLCNLRNLRMNLEKAECDSNASANARIARGSLPSDDKTIDSIYQEPLNGAITQSVSEQPQCHHSRLPTAIQ